MKRIQTTLALIQLGRLHFLVGGVVLHALGVMIALYSGAGLNIAAVIWGQIAITATQLMTHYANEYFDLEADRANQTPTRWSGGSRVLPENVLPARAALHIALVFAALGLVANVMLSTMIRPGVGTFFLILVAQLLAWFYSAPPIRLHSSGVGELSATVTVTLLTPLTGYYLQAGRVDLLPLLAVVPLCCFQFAMLLAIEFPDAEGDRLVGKRTLVVRLGARRSAHLYVVLMLCAYTVLPLLVGMGLPALAALAVTGLLPLALWQVWRVCRGDWHEPTRWNVLAFYTIVLLMASAAAELLAFTLLVGMR